MDLYISVMFGKSPLSRAQREMIAVVVSSANQCDYCIRHHSEALNFYWKDSEKTATLATNFTSVELSKQDNALCGYARDLTLHPGRNMDAGIAALKANGLDDRAVLDATLVIAYFNFVNRIVIGLGVEIEPDDGKGYNF
jgi:uncharacterized peroxidase-related enzyme